MVTKVNPIEVPNPCGSATKIQYDFNKQNLENKIEDVNEKISDTTELVKKTDYNTKITETEK